jgi:hypothetical protein
MGSDADGLEMGSGRRDREGKVSADGLDDRRLLSPCQM